MINLLNVAKYSFDKKGGVEVVSKIIHDGFKSADFKVKTIAFSNFPKKIPSFSSYKYWNLFSQPVSFKYFFSLIYYSYFSKNILIHCPNFLAYFSLPFIYRKKITLFWHSDVHNKFLYYFIFPFELYAVYRSSIIIFTSSSYYLSSYLSRIPFVKHKIKIVKLGIDDPYNFKINLSNVRKSVKEICKISNTKRIVLSIGRFVPYKNFNFILKSASKINNKYIFCIGGSGPNYNYLIKTIDNLNLKNCYIINNLTDDEKYYLLKFSKIFCLPSSNRSEAFGIVLLEALSFGIPICTANINGSGMNEINKNAVGEIFNLNTDDFISKLTKIESKISDASSIKIRNYFLKNFTSKNFIKKLKDIL